MEIPRRTLTRVYVVFGPAHNALHEALVARKLSSPVVQFKHLPIIAGNVDDGRFQLLSKVRELHVHRSEHPSYLNILKSMDEFAGFDEPSVMNVSLSPNPYPFNPLEPINVASRIVASLGHTVVFAVGNNGPKEDTLSSWSVAPWVIGVGGSDEQGRQLLSESSIGIPEDPFIRPTVVACGRTVVPLRPMRDDSHGTMVALLSIGKEGGGRDLPGCEDVEFVGTSVSAPRVTRICILIQMILRVIFLTANLLAKRARQNENSVAVVKACDHILRKARVKAPDFPIINKIPSNALEPILKMLIRLSQRGISPFELPYPTDGPIPFPTSIVKRMLEAMARSMPGYEIHQVGAGFVSDEIANDYLLRIRIRDFLDLFFPDEAASLVDAWPAAAQPLIPAELLSKVQDLIAKRQQIVPFKAL